MNILGISSFYHDSAACLLKDGQVLFAAEEERFTRIKHDNSFPLRAIQFCLKNANISIAQIDKVAYYEKPLLKFERILDTFVKTYPFSLRPFIKTMPEWIGQKIKVEQIIRRNLGFKGDVFFVPHHLSHAAAAFYPSGFKKAAVLTIDGIGEYQTTGLWRGEDCGLKPLGSLDFPDSLGLFYSTFTAFLGFRVNNDEYKMMGLAAYGRPRYLDEVYKMIEVKNDGSFKLNMDYFGFRQGFQMWSRKFESLFGQPRQPSGSITQKHKDIAASTQKATEMIYFKILNHLHQITKCENLCVGGGVALNSLANGKIYSGTPFKKVYIFGPAGDGGTCVGAAMYAYHIVLGRKLRKRIKCLDLGSRYSNDEIQNFLLSTEGLNYVKYSNEEHLLEKVVDFLGRGKTVGWFQGRMEFGPRALGSRCILAKPIPYKMKDRLNKIKRREAFRPFAGSILQTVVHEYFAVPEKNYFSPFMNFVFKVKEDKKDKVAAIVHQDGTCRIQTVNKQDGRYYRLLRKFYKKTGIPCILNTSFNLKGEPIVENPTQAFNDFLKTEIDFLIMGDYLIKRVNHRG